MNHRRIFILPTVRGFGIVFLIVLLFFIAFVYGNNLVYLLTFLLASIFFITILHRYNALAGLILKEGHCRAVFAGEAAGFIIHITNPTRFKRPNIVIAKQKPETLAIGPQTTVLTTVYSPTQQRGWHEAGTITISSTFPLGLFRAWSPIRFNLKVRVYPKPSTKKIHWKVFARSQRLYSKQYNGENSSEIWLNYEHTSGNDVEERLSQLCRWVIDAEKAGMRYGFSLPGITLPPGSGKAHAQKCLESLALYQK